MGHGEYVQETTYQYVGYGGDFSRGRRDFTCLITTGCLLALLVLLPLLLWLLAGTDSSEMYNCYTREVWSEAKSSYCCASMGLGCPTTQPATALPTQPPAPTPPADPFNCAVDQYFQWAPPKKEWCC